MAVAAMPGDVRLLRALLVGVGAVVVAVCAVQAGGAIVLAQRVADDAQNGRTIAVHYTAAIGTCVAVLVVGPWLALTSLWLLAGSCTGVVSPLRLPTLVLRLLSVTYVLLGSSYGLILSSIPPFDATGDVNLPDGRAARVELFGIYVWICMQCLSMGLVGLLKRDLRARVHGFLANRGVGVDAAAGIAELLNGVKAADVLRQAKLSFRAISLDDLTYEHLAVQHVPKQRAKRRSLIGAAFIRAARIAPDVDAPDELVSASSSDGVERACSYSADSNVRVARASHEHARASTLPTQRAAPAVEIAGAARLGHVDAFVSHSWHDPPAAKWRALQVWGAEFRAAHGRAPLLWFDRCCIDQADIDAQLPSLPVYLAGCNTLLVLHGPTYLSRLWWCAPPRAAAAAPSSTPALTHRTHRPRRARANRACAASSSCSSSSRRTCPPRLPSGSASLRSTHRGQQTRQRLRKHAARPEHRGALPNRRRRRAARAATRRASGARRTPRARSSPRSPRRKRSTCAGRGRRSFRTRSGCSR